MNGLLTAQQVANVFGVDRKTVCGWAARGELPCTVDENGWRWFRDEDVRARADVSEARQSVLSQLDRMANRPAPIRRSFDLEDTNEI